MMCLTAFWMKWSTMSRGPTRRFVRFPHPPMTTRRIFGFSPKTRTTKKLVAAYWNHLEWASDKSLSRGSKSFWSESRVSLRRCTKDRVWFTGDLDKVKYVCTEFWSSVFHKQVDTLKTNHQVLCIVSWIRNPFAGYVCVADIGFLYIGKARVRNTVRGAGDQGN